MERDKVVVGETYPSMEYDRSSKEVVGLLEVRHVPTFGYDQYLVDGEVVDPNTVHPLVENTFCPTGDGGGVDPSCSPKKEHGHGKPDLPPIQPHKSIKEATKDNPHDNEWGPRAKGKVAYGAVIFDSNGLVLLRRPMNHFDGYEWTFAKGGQDKGEHPAETASREALEETGRRLRITGVVPGGHEVSSSYLGHDGELHHGYRSTAYYYLGRSVGHHPEHMDAETFDTRWATPDKAKELISRTTNKAGRVRDLKVLEEAIKANAKLSGNSADSYSSSQERLGGESVTDNTFCPTGKGGGIDPSCSSAEEMNHEDFSREKAKQERAWQTVDEDPPEGIEPESDEFFSWLGEMSGNRWRGAIDRHIEMSGAVNTPLRRGEVLEDHIAHDVADLDKAFAHKASKLDKDTVLYRSLTPEQIGRDSFVDKGYPSVAYTKEAAKKFGDPVKIVAPKGTRAIFGSFNESELILPRNTRFKRQGDGSFLVANAGNDSSCFVDDVLQVFNAFCPTGAGGGVDPTCSPHPKLESTLVLPPDPNFISSKVDLVKANKEKVEQLKTLAKAGDVASLKAEPPHPSPKVQQYKQDLIKAIEEHEEKKAIEATGHKQGDLPGPNSELHVIKGLPGSTSPDLVEDTYGNKFVRKMPKDSNNLKADQLRNEVYTDAAYRAAGISTPKSHIVDGVKGPIKYSEFIPGAQNLAEWEQGRSIGEVKAMHKELGKNFVMDALLANYDVLGTQPVGSNILVKDGKPYRVDNGGGLKYRAQGAPKGDKFDYQVKELQTMRDPNISQGGAKVFGHVTDADIHAQIKELLPKKTAILEVIKDIQTKSTVAQRFTYLEDLLSKPPPLITPASKSATSFTAPKAASPSSPASPLHTAHGMVAHIAKNAYMAKFTKMDLEKLALLNPNGIKGGVIKIPRVTALTKKRQAEEAAKPSGRYLDSERVKELGKMFPDTTVTVLKGKYLSKNKVVGLTKSYAGEGTFTTTGTEEGQAVTDRLAGVPSHLHQYLPEIKSNSSVKLSIVPIMYDEAKHLKWKQGLTPTEHSAFDTWKGSPKAIKVAIANGDTTSEYGKTGVAIESGIAKAAPTRGVFYRGVHDAYALDQVKQIKEAGVGGTWSTNSPIGMSPNPYIGVVKFSHGDVLLRVVAKSCKSIHKEDGFSSTGPTEEIEHLGVSGTKYRIAGIYDNVHCTADDGETNKKVKHVIDLVEW